MDGEFTRCIVRHLKYCFEKLEHMEVVAVSNDGANKDQPTYARYSCSYVL